MVLYCYSFRRTESVFGCFCTFLAPVAILAASFCMMTSSCFSYRVQLSKMTSEYSGRGLMKVVYIIQRDSLSSLN